MNPKRVLEKLVTNKPPKPDPDLTAAQRSMSEAQRRLDVLRRRLALQQRQGPG